MKKTTRIILAVLLLCIVCSLVCWYLISQHNAKFVEIDGQMIPKDRTSLDFSGQTIPDTALLQQFYQLESLDVTNTGLSAEDYEALKAALPGCRIQWSVPFQGSFYPEQTTKLTVQALTDSDIALLKYFPALQQVNALACRDFDALDKLRAAHPGVEVLWQLDVGSQQLTQGAQSLVLGDGTLEELTFALSRIESLRSVDASGCHDYPALEALREQYPECEITYQVLFGNTLLEQSVTALDITCDRIAELEAILPYLPNLETVHFTDEKVDLDAAYTFRVAHPNLFVRYAFTLCGVDVTSDDTIVDLSNIPMESVQPVEDNLKYFTNLERIIMCDCGISTPEMDALGQRNPDVRFVWKVEFHSGVKVRTDVTYFMPHKYWIKLSDRDTHNLKYLIDVVALDLGHNPLSDVSFLQYMPKLKYLILADTEVSDISPVANLKELVFLELFMSNVRDYTPLLECTSLEDLNIGYAIPSDVTIFYQMPWLKHLWMHGCWKAEKQNMLRQNMPNTVFAFGSEHDVSSTGSGWRELQNYYDMRDILGMPYMTG